MAKVSPSDVAGRIEWVYRWIYYGERLEENLLDLADRLKRGAYRAKPVRRVYIPKADGRQRPLGVTALEDKLVQRAIPDYASGRARWNLSASR
jgi:hypothetical protein